MTQRNDLGRVSETMSSLDLAHEIVTEESARTRLADEATGERDSLEKLARAYEVPGEDAGRAGALLLVAGATFVFDRDGRCLGLSRADDAPGYLRRGEALGSIYAPTTD